MQNSSPKINSQKIKTFFKEKLDKLILFISFFLIISVFVFSLFILYHLIYPRKIEIPPNKFEINQSLYKEVSWKISEKNKIDDKTISQKIDPLQDPFE
ncbi:MAG: hypothetical protein AB1465_05530 [Patescibacteria group bacterium]